MEIAQNSFNGGLLMDMNDTVVPNTVLTDCLNGTLITFDGNEFILQNDSGNGRVESCALKKDFIPLGIKQYGGIIYIASVNPFTNECEIGSFPSPERNITSDELPDNLDVSIKTSDVSNSNGGLRINYLKVDFGDLEKNILRPGDKFLIYIEGLNNNDDYKNFKDSYEHLNYYITENSGERRLYHMHLAKIGENGMVTYIEEQTSAFNINHQKFFYTKDEAFNGNPDLNTIKNPGLFSIYNDKLNGYLAIVLEIEDIDSFSVDLGNVIENDNDSYDLEFSVSSISNSYNNTYGVEFEGLENITISNGSDTEIDGNCLEISESQYTSKNVSSNVKEDIPNSNITINGKFLNLDPSNIKTITIKPYSRFQYFEDLTYNLELSYSKLTGDQESTTWRYSTNSIKDYNNNEFKQVEISTDFLVRGTKNGLNRCNVMYIEFYDIHAKTSFIYPLSKIISGSYNFTVDCFPKEFNAEPYYDQDGNKLDNPKQYFNNLCGNNINEFNKIFISKSKYTDIGYSGYFLLLDRTKQSEYLDAIVKVRNNDSEGLTELKNLCLEESNGMPKCIFIKPQLGENESYFYNNCFTQEQYVNSSIYNKLRFNNFYICRLCGLDIYKEKSEQQLTFDSIYGTTGKYQDGYLSTNYRFKEYNAIYTLVTNGWFNNEYSKPITDYNRDFSTLPIENYETKRLSGELSLSETQESINKQLNITGPKTESELIRDTNPGDEYSTVLSTEKTITGEYSLNTINLFQYGDIDISIKSTTPKFTKVTLEENNNIPTLPTNSEINSQKTTDISINGNEDNRKLTIVVDLNREVHSLVSQKEIKGDKIKYIKAVDSLNIMGFNGNNISFGIPYFDDLNSDDWVCIADPIDIFVDTSVRDSWMSAPDSGIIKWKGSKIISGLHDVSAATSKILNRIQSLFKYNNQDYKIAIIGFAGGTKSPKNGEYSPTLLRENEGGSVTSCIKLLRDEIRMNRPYSYLILYKNTANSNYPIGVLPLVFQNNLSPNSTNSSIAKFFNNLYKEEVESDGITYNKYIPSNIEYHSNFDSIIEGEISLDTVYDSDINVNDSSLSTSINDLVSNYKKSLKSNSKIINIPITNNDYSQMEITRSFNIPISYIFKSNIFSSDLSTYSKLYNTSASYTSYISITPNNYLSYKRGNEFIPISRLSIKDKGFYFPQSEKNENIAINGPHTNSATVLLTTYADGAEATFNNCCNPDTSKLFSDCNLYLGWDQAFGNEEILGDIGNVTNLFSTSKCS